MKFDSTYNPEKIARIVKRHEKKHRKKYEQTGEFPIIAIVEWCFYVRVKLHPKWFSGWWWMRRKANTMSIQVCNFWIEIGMPWNEDVLRGAFFDFKEWPKYLDEATQENEKTQWPGWIFHQVYELKNEFENAEIKQ